MCEGPPLLGENGHSSFRASLASGQKQPGPRPQRRLPDGGGLCSAGFSRGFRAWVRARETAAAFCCADLTQRASPVRLPRTALR